jgi:HK97 family phage portal protein
MKFQWPIKFTRSHAEQKSVVLGTSDALGSFLMFGQGAGGTPSSALDLYDKSTAVSIPVNMVADAFASIAPVIKFKDEIIDDHPVLDLLNNPSPFYSRTLLFEILGKDYLVTGETEIVALGGVNRPPLELQPISPKNVSVNESQGGVNGAFIISGNTVAGSYLLTRVKSRARYLDGGLREIKQIRNYSTKNNSLLRGQSPLVSASKEAQQHIKGGEHNISLLDNGGRVSLVFHFDADLNSDEFKETKERVIAQYGGTSKAGMIGVTAGGKLDIKEAGVNNKDMDFANLQGMAQRAVALQYKVPLPLMTTDAATFTNFKESRAALYTDAVLPLADRVFDGLTDLLMPRYGLDPNDYRITYDKTKIEALSSVALEELKLRKEINIESDNELRASIGRKPYKGGDVVLKPANLIPAGTDIFAEPSEELDTEPAAVLLRDQEEEEEEQVTEGQR